MDFSRRMAYQQSMPKNMMVCHPCQYQSMAENQPTGIDHKGCPFNTWKDDQRFCRRRWSFKTFCWFDFVDFGGLMVALALRKNLQHLQRNIIPCFEGKALGPMDFDGKKRRKIKSNQRCHYSNPASFAEAVSGSIIIEEAPIQGGSIPKQEIPNGYVELGWFPDLFSRTKMIVGNLRV